MQGWNAEHLDALGPLLAPHSLTRDSETCSYFGTDWTQRIRSRAFAVVSPQTVEDLQKTVVFAFEHSLPLVPSGGRTGLAGGAVAEPHEIAVSLSKLNRIEEPIVSSMSISVQAGAITEAVNDRCKPLGLHWPIDLAAKGSSQIGGNLATNAGGIHVVRYGMARNWVLGLDVIIGTGERLTLNSTLEKNNAGYDLRHLFIGSEGTLGIIAGAHLKLAVLPRTHSTILVALNDPLTEGSPKESKDALLPILEACRKAPAILHAFEFFDEACIRLVSKYRQRRFPLQKHFESCLLIEFENNGPAEEFLEWCNSLLAMKNVQDIALAQNPSQQGDFWGWREMISESIRLEGIPSKWDVAVSVDRFQPFYAAIKQRITQQFPTNPLYLFGHAGDGNLHINILNLDEKTFASVERAMMEIIQLFDGTISAEHGVGLFKRELLAAMTKPAEMNAWKALKRTFDPRGIMNPRKIFL